MSAPPPSLSLRRSHDLLSRADRVVPGGGIYGHQSPRMLVPGEYPAFFARGQGCRIWDVDGNAYIDFMCSYGPIVLGHRHPSVEAAVERQRAAGVCFNGPGEPWVALAERLVELTPWADWAVFAKNGSDVCTWAVQVAREATGRKLVARARGAYHGTHAWCAPLPGGVVAEDIANRLEFDWNDLASLEAVLEGHRGAVAAVIVTPFRHDAFHDSELPARGFHDGVRDLATRHGALLILDDVRCGFRFHLGGSGEHFGIRPDLTCYCKAIANGYPLAVALGRDDLKKAASKVFFTGSYWTSPEPMVAALATLEALAAEDGIAALTRAGERFTAGLVSQARTHGFEVKLSGPPAMPFMSFADDPTFARNRAFCAAAIRRGVYLHPHHNWFLSSAHDNVAIDAALAATDDAFTSLRA